MLRKIFVVVGLILLGEAIAQQPLIRHIFTADPTAKVWDEDTTTLWLYVSRDEPRTNHHATMFDYHVLSTKDLVNWTDHGRVLSVDDVPWAISHAWAVDAVHRNGQYYLVYCMVEAATGMFRTGLAVNDIPQGPFCDVGFIEGVEWGQDPCLFIDHDNTPYLIWGSQKRCHAVQLSDDLRRAIPETYVELTGQLDNFFEGPFLHKYDGKYYLSYPGLPQGRWPEEMYYAVADSPLGKYRSKGKYIGSFDGMAGTNQGSMIKFNGRWIAFYHSAHLSGGMSAVRNVMAEFLYYNSDGSLQFITPTKEGVTGGVATNCKILLEAENAPMAGGRLFGTKINKTTDSYSGKGYVDGFNLRQNYCQVLAHAAKEMKARLKIRYRADDDFAADILVGNVMMAGWDGLPMSGTGGKWQEVDLGEVTLQEGNNRIRFTCVDDKNVAVDYFILDIF